MGTDPDDGAVVDGHLQVYGVDALHVVDASVMPTRREGSDQPELHRDRRTSRGAAPHALTRERRSVDYVGGSSAANRSCSRVRISSVSYSRQRRRRRSTAIAVPAAIAATAPSPIHFQRLDRKTPYATHDGSGDHT